MLNEPYIRKCDIWFKADTERLWGLRNCTIYLTYRAWYRAPSHFFIEAKMRGIEVKVLEWL